MDIIKIKPASPDLIVRDPVTKTPLSNKGEIKPMRGAEGIYWRRRLKEKSVIQIKENKNPIEKNDELGPPRKKKFKFGGKE